MADREPAPLVARTWQPVGCGVRPLSSGGRAPLAHRPPAEMLATVETTADLPVAGTTADLDENRDA
jgi:hypothetical protein